MKQARAARHGGHLWPVPREGQLWWPARRRRRRGGWERERLSGLRGAAAEAGASQLGSGRHGGKARQRCSGGSGLTQRRPAWGQDAGRRSDGSGGRLWRARRRERAGSAVASVGQGDTGRLWLLARSVFATFSATDRFARTVERNRSWRTGSPSVVVD